MNSKKAVSTLEFFIVSIIILLSALTIFLLTSLGVIQVREYDQVDVLNMEFLPYVREGILTIHNLQLCDVIDFDKSCVNEKNVFTRGETVSMRFVAETSAVSGQVFLLENFRVRDPTGNVVLTADNEFPFETETNEKKQFVLFTDYFVLGNDYIPGEYTLELVVENPYLSREVTVVERFDVR